MAITQLTLVCAALLTRLLVRGLSEGSRSASVICTAVFIPIISLLGNAASQNLYAIDATEAATFRGAVIYAVLERTAHVSDAARLGSWSDGRVLNLLSSDAQRLLMLLMEPTAAWLSPSSICIIVGILFAVLGWPAIVGVTVVLVGVAVNVLLGRIIFGYRSKVAERADTRMEETHAAFSSLLTIKLHGWEATLAERIQAVRGQEIEPLLRRKSLDGLDYAFGNVVPVLALLATFATWNSSRSDGQPSGPEVFASFL